MFFVRSSYLSGNSASVDHLIENELPLSTLNSPVSDAMAVVTLDHRTMQMMSSSSDEQLYNHDESRRASDNDLEVDDVGDEDDDDVHDANVSASIKHLGIGNNMSGSYSNLFRAERTDIESADVIQAATEVMGGENVYSNVPFGSPGDLSSSTHIPPPTSDPSLHVYSNVASTVAGKSMHDISFGGVSAILVANSTPSNADSLLQMRRYSGEGQASSTMMADDLDLDDAVMGAGAFSKNQHKTVNDSNQSVSNTTKVQQHVSKKMSAVSIELTNVIPQVNSN